MTNKLSESLSPKFDVCTMSDNEGYNPTSEVCPKSTIRSLKTCVLSPQSEIGRCPTSVRKLSELCPKSEVLHVCSKPGVQKPKSDVQSMSKVQNPSLKPKSEVCQLFKSETEVQSLTPKI